MLDRDTGLAEAIGTSLRAVLANPGPMAVWGFIVATALVVGSIPLFLGLIVVMPCSGTPHGTFTAGHRGGIAGASPFRGGVPRENSTRLSPDGRQSRGPARHRGATMLPLSRLARRKLLGEPAARGGG